MSLCQAHATRARLHCFAPFSERRLIDYRYHHLLIRIKRYSESNRSQLDEVTLLVQLKQLPATPASRLSGMYFREYHLVGRFSSLPATHAESLTAILAQVRRVGSSQAAMPGLVYHSHGIEVDY